MKTLQFLFAAIISSITLQTWAQAPAGLRVEAIGYSGSGCPQGTVQASVAPDSSAVSFLFDSYGITAQNGNAFANCTVRFLLRPPRGYSLTVVGVEYRGALILGEGAKAHFQSKITEQISRMVREIHNSSQSFSGPVNDLLYVNSTSFQPWLPCGVAGMNFIFQSQLGLENPTGEEALVSVDSADTQVGATFHLAWQRCQ